MLDLPPVLLLSISGRFMSTSRSKLRRFARYPARVQAFVNNSLGDSLLFAAFRMKKAI